MSPNPLNLLPGAVGQGQAQIIYGEVATPLPSEFDDPLYVFMTDWSNTHSFKIVDWPAVHGSTLPSTGAEVLLVKDNHGTLRVVWWEGSTLLEDDGEIDGGDAASSDTGEIDCGNATSVDDEDDEELVSVKDYGAVGDGVTDNTSTFAAAVAALPSRGGTLFLPPGDYVGTISVNATKRVLILGYGARLLPPAGTSGSYSVGVSLTTGNLSNVVGGGVMGLAIDCRSHAFTEGIRFTASDEIALRDVRIDNATIGWRLTNPSDNTWTEAANIDGLYINACTTGVQMDYAVGHTGNNSFDETSIRGLGINNCNSAFFIQDGADLERVKIEATIWLSGTQTGLTTGANMAGARTHLAFENQSNTAVTGIVVTSAATNLNRWFSENDFAVPSRWTGGATGTKATVGTGLAYLWFEGNQQTKFVLGPGGALDQLTIPNEVIIQAATGSSQWFFHNDGKLYIGNLVDTNLYRAFANILKTDSFFVAGGGISPGTPAGASQNGFVYQGSGVPSNANGNNGDIYFRTDTPGTANQRIYIRSAGVWTGIL